uniref:Uncharacterized protein n=1 Tax=Neospora caninum (strain Liverpool) TaxID=572307 RepID=A0A0F7U7A6_NEOCL|nr:TPA: hypothetical protein BN1204_015825 [Neospora caninum Liverpool]
MKPCDHHTGMRLIICSLVLIAVIVNAIRSKPWPAFASAGSGTKKGQNSPSSSAARTRPRETPLRPPPPERTESRKRRHAGPSSLPVPKTKEPWPHVGSSSSSYTTPPQAGPSRFPFPLTEAGPSRFPFPTGTSGPPGVGGEGGLKPQLLTPVGYDSQFFFPSSSTASVVGGPSGVGTDPLAQRSPQVPLSSPQLQTSSLMPMGNLPDPHRSASSPPPPFSPTTASLLKPLNLPQPGFLPLESEFMSFISGTGGSEGGSNPPQRTPQSNVPGGSSAFLRSSSHADAGALSGPGAGVTRWVGATTATTRSLAPAERQRDGIFSQSGPDPQPPQTARVSRRLIFAPAGATVLVPPQPTHFPPLTHRGRTLVIGTMGSVSLANAIRRPLLGPASESQSASQTVSGPSGPDSPPGSPEHQLFRRRLFPPSPPPVSGSGSFPPSS